MTRKNEYRYIQGQGLSDTSGYAIEQGISKLCKQCFTSNTHGGFTCKRCGAPLYSIQRKDIELAQAYQFQYIKFDTETVTGTVYIIRKKKIAIGYIYYDEDYGNSYIVKLIGGKVWKAIGEYDG